MSAALLTLHQLPGIARRCVQIEGYSDARGQGLASSMAFSVSGCVSVCQCLCAFTAGAYLSMDARAPPLIRTLARRSWSPKP